MTDVVKFAYSEKYLLVVKVADSSGSALCVLAPDVRVHRAASWRASSSFNSQLIQSMLDGIPLHRFQEVFKRSREQETSFQRQVDASVPFAFTGSHRCIQERKDMKKRMARMCEQVSSLAGLFEMNIAADPAPESSLCDDNGTDPSILSDCANTSAAADDEVSTFRLTVLSVSPLQLKPHTYQLLRRVKLSMGSGSQ